VGGSDASGLMPAHSFARRQVLLALLGTACFAIALLLPAFSTRVLGAPVSVEGWVACFASLDMLAEGVWRPDHLLGAPLVWVGAALCNLVFIAAPFVLARPRETRWRYRLVLVPSALGLLLGLLSTHLLTVTRVEPGYQLWLAGFAVVLLAGHLRSH